VCTGNVCRSPLMQLMLTAGFDERLGLAGCEFEVLSAGTFGLPGHSIEPDALQALEDRGVVGGRSFKSRRMEPAHLADIDLLLGASREHRTAAVAMEPSLLRRAFTLREFARVAASLNPSGLPIDTQNRAELVVRQASAQRGLVRAAEPGDDDVTDPIGLGAAVHERVGEQIADAVTCILDVLAARDTTAPSA
jgi:protein-tyrosine phosphatase